MKILGIHVRTHDTSIAYIDGGKIVYAAANERFSRVKMDRNSPVEVLKNFFEYTKVKPKDIDSIIFVEDPLPRALWLNYKENSWPITSTGGKYLFWLKNPSLIFAELIIAPGLVSYLYRFYFSRKKINKLLKGFNGKISFDHHHFAHMHSAYYTSGWDECLVMANEGSGFTQTLSIYHVKSGNWVKIIENFLPNSVGKFYELVTELLGFDRHKHPGKITGLSGYGNPNKLSAFVNALIWIEKDKVILNHNKYLKLLAFYANYRKLPPELEKFKREDIAAAFQKRLEDILVNLVTLAIKKTKIKKIALAGGVSANVKANQKIHEIKGLEGIHIHQAMGDDGLALGAALHASFLAKEKVKQPNNVYFGPDFSNKAIEKELNKFGIKFRKLLDIEKETAKILSSGNVVARFSGKMEYGPRALGNRSIMYNTKDKTVNNWLNKRLKRTEFMPFAPVTLSEFAEKCYKNLKGAEYSSRFMTLTFECTKYMKKVSPAVVHVDGTARPQILRREDNPSYYKILNEYYKITGIPSLVNTSFNMHEEPIVCTPGDAIRAFLSSGIDYLSIGNYLVSAKENQRLIQKSKTIFAKAIIKKENSFMRFLDH